MSRSRDREQLRQERIAFDEQQIQCAHMFRLKMLFGYLALAVFAGISVLAALFAIHANFTAVSLAISGSVFVGNAISLVAFVIKWVLKRDDMTVLRPLIGEASGRAPSSHAALI